MIDLYNYDFFIFDCDGVILDSNNLKSSAFADALSDEPRGLVSEFVEYHKRNGGISRYEKFKYYFEVMKNLDQAEPKVKKALYNYANIVSKSLLKCSYVPGVIKFIEMLSKINKPLFVVTGSDEKELIQVFKKRGIDKYFKKIYGSPIDKKENIKKVLYSFDEMKNGLLFGDSQIDYQSAKEFNIKFIFIRNYSEWADGYKIIGSNNTINDFNFFYK